MEPVFINLPFFLISVVGLSRLRSDGPLVLLWIVLAQGLVGLVAYTLGYHHWNWQIFGGLQVACWWLL